LDGDEYRSRGGLLMNPIQRLVDYGQKRFNEMLFPGSGGGGDWNYYGSNGYYGSSQIVFPGVTDWSVDTRASSAVAACVNWFCRTFPEAPLQVVQTNRDGEREVVTAHPLPALLEMPNPFYSGVLLWDATLSDWMIDGNAYWVKVRNGQGAVLQLWWTPSSLIEPRWSRDNAAEFIGWYDYQPDPSRDRKIKLDPSDVVHFRYGIDPDNMRKGRSPLASVMREIFTDEEAARYSAALLKNMGVPGIIVSPESDGLTGGMLPGDAKQITEQLMRKTTGDQRGQPLFISAGIKVHTLSFNPQQMNLKDLRRIPEERVTAALGIPAIVAGLGAGLDRSTYSNMAEAREAAYESFIIPNQRRFGSDIRTQLLPDFGSEGQRIEWDTSNVRVLQEDENKKALRWSQLAKDGVVTRDEARTALGLPIETEMEQEESGAKSATPILGYHIESGVVSRNEARRQLGLQPEDESEDLNLRRLQTKLTVMKLAVDAGIPPEEAAGLVNLQVTVEMPPQTPPQLPPPVKALEPEFKSYGSQVRAIEGRAARATTAYLQEQYERAAAAGKGWQRALDMGTEARSLYNRFYPLILRHSWNDAAAELGIELAFDLENRWVKGVLDELAKAIVGIAETTREEVRSLVAKQAEEGWSIDELAAEIRKLKEVHSTARARTIARSETAIAYNKGSLAGYREAGVEKVEVFDGDEHEPCRSANGSIWTIEQAEAEPLCHPNGTRAFAAVIGED
jgi:HK97 family phage portal protein